MNEGRLLLDLRQPARLGQEAIVNVECRFHMYEYGCFSHISQALHPLAPSLQSRNTCTRITQIVRTIP